MQSGAVGGKAAENIESDNNQLCKKSSSWGASGVALAIVRVHRTNTCWRCAYRTGRPACLVGGFDLIPWATQDAAPT